MLEIGEDQFLVLLLVVDAEFEQRAQFRCQRGIGNELRDVPVDVMAVGEHFRERRTRQQAAFRAWVARPDRDVVGIEQYPELRIEHAVPGARRLEQEGLEKPGRMREVPFDGACIGHRLQRAVFRRQRLRELLRLPPHSFELRREQFMRTGAFRNCLPPGIAVLKAHFASADYSPFRAGTAMLAQPRRRLSAPNFRVSPGPLSAGIR